MICSKTQDISLKIPIFPNLGLVHILSEDCSTHSGEGFVKLESGLSSNSTSEIMTSHLLKRQQENLGDGDRQELGAREQPSHYTNSPLGASEILESCKEDAV